VLADVNGGYYLSSTRGVQLLQINGQQMRENIGGGWNVVGAEDTLTGFQVVWENASTGTFAYWNADSNGNYLNAKVINSFQLKSFETSFQQDLDNFNGIDSLTQAGTTGNASLLMQANNGYVIDGANGIQFLNYQGSQITPGFSTDWTLNGVSNQGSGYVAHWTRNSDALSAYWLTNSTGDFLSSGLA
jgi:serralysin